MPATAKKLDEAQAVKLTIERATLLKSLGKLQSIVEKRNTIPILANVKLEAGKNALTLTTTDMDLVASEKVKASVDKQGAFTVPAHTLYDIIRKLPEGSQVSLESDAENNQVRVESGNAKFTLSFLPASDFPAIAEGELTHKFTLPAGDCRAFVDKTRFAISTEETRYYLNGVYMHAHPNDNDDTVLKVVATDGHRLARIEMPLPDGADGMPGVIIPRKSVAELRKLIEEADGDVKISLSASKIRFEAGNTILVSKLIDGTFPDYERVIPESNDKIMECEAKIFLQAVDRVSTVSTDKTRAVKLALDSGKMMLTANSPESGTAEEEVEVKYSSDPLEIGFNSKYVLEMMSQLEGDSAQFLFSDPAAPVLVRDPSDVGALYVIMPMRV